MKTLKTSYRTGKPVHCTKAELKGTKKCVILENGLNEENYWVIKYESGISYGEAHFDNTDAGVALMKKFLKLLEK